MLEIIKTEIYFLSIFHFSYHGSEEVQNLFLVCHVCCYFFFSSCCRNARDHGELPALCFLHHSKTFHLEAILISWWFFSSSSFFNY